LVLAHPDAAYDLAYCLQNRHDAKDLVLDAYVRAFRAFDAFIQAAGVGIFVTDINQPNAFLARARPVSRRAKRKRQ
jgi:DNA-directed RNA polymerase specialized sigma24 family protein